MMDMINKYVEINERQSFKKMSSVRTMWEHRRLTFHFQKASAVEKEQIYISESLGDI